MNWILSFVSNAFRNAALKGMASAAKDFCPADSDTPLTLADLQRQFALPSSKEADEKPAAITATGNASARCETCNETLVEWEPGGKPCCPNCTVVAPIEMPAAFPVLDADKKPVRLKDKKK